MNQPPVTLNASFCVRPLLGGPGSSCVAFQSSQSPQSSEVSVFHLSRGIFTFIKVYDLKRTPRRVCNHRASAPDPGAPPVLLMKFPQNPAVDTLTSGLCFLASKSAWSTCDGPAAHEVTVWPFTENICQPLLKDQICRRRSSCRSFRFR